MDISNLQEYLQSTGAIHGTDADIEKAKLTYRKLYQQKYNQAYRKKRKRVSIVLLPYEYQKLEEESKIYESSVPQFVRNLVLERIGEKKLIPFPNDHARLVQELSSFHRTIQELKTQATDYITIQQGYEMISQKVNDLQAHLLGYDY